MLRSNSPLLHSALATALVLSFAAASVAGAAESQKQAAPAQAEVKDAKPGEPETAAPPREFDHYFLVFLRRGPTAIPEGSPEAKKLLGQHLGHLTKLVRMGKLAVAGPFGDQKDESLRGMSLFKTATMEEARQLAEEDPGVKAGWLRVEVMSWYTLKGALAFPLSPQGK